MTNIITTREQVEAIENGSVLSDVQGYTLVRDHAGDFMLYDREQEAFIPFSAEEIMGDYADPDEPSVFLPMTLLTVIPASLMRDDLPTGRL